MKKILFILLILLFIFACSTPNLVDLNEEQKADNQLNEEMAKLMSFYARAMTENDSGIVEEFNNYLAEFDSKYNTNFSEEFTIKKNLYYSQMKSSSGGSSYAPLTDLPINKDGAVYLSGGNDGAVSIIISFVAPKATNGKYFHGASLDLDKFDPTNLDCQCFHTAVLKGAGYESPNEWMRKPNVTVLKPVVTLNQTALNNAQKALDYYCSPSNKNMKYGFFKDYANIFSIVTKEDNYYWYCTKVVWRIYNAMGINIDSNSTKVDWTTSGLYSMVKAYYNTIYFYNSSKAKEKLNEYITDAKNKIVLAEEIYFSPYFTQIYEKIRSY